MIVGVSDRPAGQERYVIRAVVVVHLRLQIVVSPHKTQARRTMSPVSADTGVTLAQGTVTSASLRRQGSAKAGAGDLHQFAVPARERQSQVESHPGGDVTLHLAIGRQSLRRGDDAGGDHLCRSVLNLGEVSIGQCLTIRCPSLLANGGRFGAAG